MNDPVAQGISFSLTQRFQEEEVLSWILSHTSWEGKDEGDVSSQHLLVRKVITKCREMCERKMSREQLRGQLLLLLETWFIWCSPGWILDRREPAHKKGHSSFPPSCVSFLLSFTTFFFKSVNTHLSRWLSHCVDTQWEKSKTAKSAQRGALTAFSQGLSLPFLRPPPGVKWASAVQIQWLKSFRRPLEVTEALAIKHAGPTAFPRKALSVQTRGTAPFSPCPLFFPPSDFLCNNTWLLCSSSRTEPIDCGLGLVDSFLCLPSKAMRVRCSLELGKCYCTHRVETYLTSLDTMTVTVASRCTSVRVKMAAACRLYTAEFVWYFASCFKSFFSCFASTLLFLDGV